MKLIGFRSPIVLGVLALLFVLPVAAQPRAQWSDEQVRQELIRESVAAYNATGRPCACPDQLDRAGHSCGGRSGYSRPGGAAPLCYSKDVTDSMVAGWRARHP